MLPFSICTKRGRVLSRLTGARGRRSHTNGRNRRSTKEEVTESKAAGWTVKATERARGRTSTNNRGDRWAKA